MTAWRHVRLGDLGTWSGGGTPSKNQPDFWKHGTVPWLSPKDMHGDVLKSTLDKITDAAVERSAVRLVEPDSVAVVVRSGILERTLPVALVPFATTLNQDMKALTCGPEVTPGWVAWGLRANEGHLLRETRKAGTTVASIEWPRFLDSTLPVPPIVEQRRIVDILEDHLSRLDAAEQALRMSIRRAESLEKVALEGTHEGDLRPLGAVAEVQGGIQKQPKRRPAHNAHPYLRVANVTAKGLDLAEVHSIELFDGELSRYRLETGDLLVVEGNGSPNQIGRAALWDGTIEDCVHQNHLIRVRPAPVLLPAFLEMTWNSSRTRRALTALSSSSSGLHTLSVGKLMSLSIPVPPIDRQATLAGEIRTIRDARRSLERSLTHALEEASALRRVLLAAAFSGRLTGRSSDLDLAEELVS